MGADAVQITNFPDLSDPICACIDKLTTFFTEARMEIGQGMTQIAMAMTACCEAQFVTPQTYSYDVLVPDGNGGQTTQTINITGPGSQGLAGVACLVGQQNANATWAATQSQWQELWQMYMDEYDDWRNQITTLYIAQIAADLIILSEMLGLRRDFLQCAKEALGDLKTFQSCMIEASTGQVKTEHEAHIANVNAKSPTMMDSACAHLDDMGTRSELLEQLWSQSGEGAGLGYSPAQSAHVENMATHLGQLCFLGRDSANDLSTLCAQLDDTWLAGGGWKLFEDKITDPAGGFQTSVCATASCGQEITEYMKDCGQMLANLFASDTGTGEYQATIKPIMDNLIAALNEGGETLLQIQNSIESSQQCVTTIKERYEVAYSDAEEVISPEILAGAGELLTRPDLFTDCFDFLRECATTYKDGFSAYHETGELPLSAAIFTQAQNIATQQNHQQAIDFINTYKTDCLAVYQNTYADGEQVFAINMLALADEMVNCVRLSHQWLCDHADEMDACWQAGYSGEKAWASTLLTQAEAILENHGQIIDWLCDCADDIKACYLTDYQPGEKLLAAGIYNAATTLVANFIRQHDFFDDKALDHYNCWLQDYQPGEKLTGGNIYTTANKLITEVCDNNDWFDSKAAAEFDCWLQDYQPGEKALATLVFGEAQAVGPEISTMYDWFKQKAIVTENCFEDDYLPKEKAAMVEIMDEGTVLADCVSLTHNWLCAQADKTYDHWCEFWIPKEREYVCALLDKAIELACESYECLADWCEIIDDQLEWWRECYENAECTNLPKLIEAITPACVKNTELFNDTCTRSEKQYNGWCDYWAQCDIDDMIRHCQITDKTQPLENICINNECTMSLGEILKACYEGWVLPCEKNYIDEICQLEKYNPRYCEVQDRSIAHVREQYGVTEEKLRKTAGKFCSGSLIHSLTQLESERVRTESASIQAADRWEWWRTMQECDRRHRYKLDIFQVGERYATNSMQAYQLSTQGNDIILGRIHERLMRGFQWLTHSEQNSAQTYQGMSTAMNMGIQATQVGHFWPEWWTQNKNAYLSHTETRLSQSNDLMRIGQSHNQQAFNSKTQAGQMALGAMDRTLQSIGQGHELAQLSSADKQQAMRVIESAIQFAQNSVNQGHSINAQGTNDKQIAQAIIEESIRQAQQTIQHGHTQAQLASSDENSAHAVANNAVSQGQTTVQLGHAHLQRSIDTKNAALRGTEAVTDDAVQTARLGQFYHQQASADKQAAMQGALGAIDDGHQAVNNGLNHKSRALDAANLEGQQANAALQTGLATVDRGHNLGNLAVNTKRAANDFIAQTWGQFTNHLEHARGLLTTAANFQQIADSMIRDIADKGMQAAQYELAVYQTAIDKTKAAQTGAAQAVDDMLQMYNQSLQRQQQVLSNKQAQADWVRSSIGTFTPMMDMGNRHFLGGSNTMLNNETQMRKQCMEYLCDTIMRNTNMYWTKACQSSQAIFNLSYGAANDATQNSQDSLNSIFAGINGIIGPPPVFQPPGALSGGPPNVTTYGVGGSYIGPNSWTDSAGFDVG